MGFTIKVNYKNLTQAMDQISPSLQEKLTKKIEGRLIKQSNKALDAINNHPVTQEIEGGAYAKNSSGTLLGSSSATNNLFSFIGFNAGSEPTQAIKEFFEYGNSIGIKSIRKASKKPSFTFTIQLPTLEDIYDATRELDWTDDSWAESIETGIRGYSKFLAKSGLPSSRSEGGVQSKYKVREGIYRPRSYLTPIYNKFVAGITKLSNEI